MWPDGSGPVRSLEIGLLDPAPGRFGYRITRPSLPSAARRLGAQISPDKSVNCRCTSAAFSVSCIPVGFAVLCQLASHPSALTMRFLSVASHLLHSGFLWTSPRGLAVAFSSWLSLLTLSPSRYSHRRLPPHRFAPMLGAHPSLKWSANSRTSGPIRRYAKHFRQPGPDVLLSSPA